MSFSSVDLHPSPVSLSLSSSQQLETSLTTMPAEILVKIFAETDLKTWATGRRVCKQFNIDADDLHLKVLLLMRATLNIRSKMMQRFYYNPGMRAIDYNPPYIKAYKSPENNDINWQGSKVLGELLHLEELLQMFQQLKEEGSKSEKLKESLEKIEKFFYQFSINKYSRLGSLFQMGFNEEPIPRRYTGKVKIKFLSGLTFEGLIEENDFVKGKVTCSDRTIYDGVYTHNWLYKGTKVCSDGTILESSSNGYFNNFGYLYDQGKKTLLDGSVYEGKFIGNDLYGPGKLTFANGDFYQGNFQADKVHGKGKMVLVNGEVYRGKFKDGKFNRGIKTLPDGTTFEGKFRKKKLHGQGKVTYPNGFVEQGVFHYGWLRNDLTLCSLI